MHEDVKTLVRSLSKLADWYFEVGEPPPISGATIDSRGELEFVTPPKHRSSSWGIENLEETFRQRAEEGSSRACASLLEVSVRDPAGAVVPALRISTEIRDGEALDVFVPCEPDATGRVRPDRRQVYSLPRAPRVFVSPSSPPRPERSPAPPRQREEPSDPQIQLLTATAEGDLDAMARALARGARIDQSVRRQTAVQVALRTGDPEILDWLLSQGASIPKLGLRDWQQLNRPGRQPVLEVLDDWGHRAPGWLRAVQGLTRRDAGSGSKPKSKGPWSAVQARSLPENSSESS